MKLDKESLINNLWDTHQIIRETELRKQFIQGSAEQRKEIVHFYFLNRCLHHRRIQDPGFFQKIMDCIARDPETVKKTTDYVHKLFGDLTSSYEDFFNHESITCKKNQIHVGPDKEDRSRAYLKAKRLEDFPAILRCNYYAAIEKGDENEAIAIRDQMVKSISLQALYSGDLFLKENHNPDLKRNLVPVGVSRWDAEGRFFLASRIKNFDKYLKSRTNDFDTYLLKSVEYPLATWFCEKFEIIPVNSSTLTNPEKSALSIKFIQDCLRIAAEFYFDTLEESEKISLLNSEYSFLIDLKEFNQSVNPYLQPFVSPHPGKELPDEQIDHLWWYVTITKDSFQFSLCSKYLEKILSISPDPKTRLNAGKENFEIGYYPVSIKILEPLIHSASDPEIRQNALLYSGTSRLLSGDRGTGISELRELIDSMSVEMSKSDEEKDAHLHVASLMKVFRYIIERGLWQGESEIVAIVDDLKNYALRNTKILPEELLDVISFAYLTVGWDEKALSEEMNALETVDYNSDSYMWFCYLIALLQLRSGDYQKGLIWLERAVNHPSGNTNLQLKAKAISKIAQTYFLMSKFNEAREFLQKACETNPEITDIEFFRGAERLEEYLSNQISYESIHNPDVRSIFKTAEHHFNLLYVDVISIGNKEEYDLSPALFNYGKGMEVFLDVEIWADLRAYIFKIFSEDGTCIENDEIFNKIPEYFKMALSKYSERRKTVSLGTWSNIDFNKKANHEVIREINTYLENRFGSDFEIIRSACGSIAPYRNFSGHREVIRSSDEIIEKRKKIIPVINSVIHIVSSKNSVAL